MIRLLTLAVALCLTLSACQSRSSKSGDAAFENELLAPVGLQRAPAQRFPDVPLPLNVKEDTERTYVYETRSIQIGRMVYTVKESVNDVAQFYIRECPNYGWTMDSALQAEGIMLVFKQPGKRLLVSVTKTGLVDRGSLLILNYTPDAPSNITPNNSIQSSPL
jgi:hypothetical protein